MARKKQKADPMTEFREAVIGSIARLEANVERLLANQEQNRETIEATLREHTAQDAENFERLTVKQDRTERLVNYGVGGVIVLQVIIGIALAVLAL